MAELFLRNGANIEARSKTGETPLLVLAGEPEREDVMVVLLEAGADVNATGLAGHTPLDIAIDRQEDDKADLLRHFGAKRSQRP
jgi:ankyrin repeat protein